MDRSNSQSDILSPLLTTNLRIPRLRGEIIAREILIEKMDQALNFPLTLISAAAGFGKTTLVSSWLAHANLPAAWLSLDEEDSDFTRFWTYFIAALQTIQPEMGAGVLALLQSSPLPHSHTLLTLLINDLTAISEKFILVLDDYHNIETDTIDQALIFFIDHIPLNMHLVVISRVDPNLPLARLRANRQLNELRSADLRFTQAETALFLEQMTGHSLTPADLAVLDSRTEGWIAGVQMAALSLRQREAATVAQFIEDFSGSHRYIMDYLVNEVLQGQSAEVQTFLLYTSVLDRLCGPLCEAILRGCQAPGSVRDFNPPPEVSDASTAQELLTYLEHANLFIYPLDDQRHWYRYHALFADLLRQRLQQTYPDKIATLHLCASQWFEQTGLTGQAVQHALAAQAYGRAAVLIEQVAPTMIEHSDLARLLKWLDTLPEEEVLSRPRLGVYYVWSLFFSGEIKQATTRLEAIEAVLETDDSKQTPEVQSYIAAMRARLLQDTGDFTATIALSQQALAHLPDHATLPRARITLNLAIVHYLQGEFETASQLLTETITTGQTAQLALNTISAIYLKAQLLRDQGALQQALKLCQEGLDLVARRNWHNFPAIGYLYVAFSDLLRERNELSIAMEYLEKGIRLGQEGGNPFILITGNVRLAWLYQTQGDLTSSQEAIRAALQLVQEHQVSRFLPIPPAACYQARLWIAQGDLTAASRWAQESGLNQTHSPVTFLYEVDYLTLARLLIAQGNLDEAETLLLRLNRAARETGRNGSLIEILILQSITFSAQKRSEEALSALANALSLAELEGFVRIFLDEGAPMAELLRLAVAQSLHASYALRLLEALGKAPAIPQHLIDPLSERELEVLRQVAAGYSNQQIAQELVLAVSTVKKHINNIYGKLGVGSRTQAVARARELDLL